jgi:hypothetical protein
MMDLHASPDKRRVCPVSHAPTDLKPGWQLRDHGRLRTIVDISTVRSRIQSSIVVSFEDDGGDLSIPLDAGVLVTVWRPDGAA